MANFLTRQRKIASGGVQIGNEETLREDKLRFDAWMDAVESDMHIPMTEVKARKNRNL